MADGDSDCDVLDGHPTMTSNRLSLRLGKLPHAVLAELAARLCSESPALQATAEKCMVAHTPLSHELVELVLLSPDLVPCILGPLEAEGGAAAAVCSQWLAGWTATNEPPWPRRRLKQVPLELPALDIHDCPHVSATPDGRLAVVGDARVHILDRSMRLLQTVACENYGVIAASDDSIFHTHERSLHRTSQDGTAQVEYELEGRSFDFPLLAPGGLLFCVAYDTYNERNGEQDEIIALDAQTLQLRHRFGLGLFNSAHRLEVVGDELYVCDTGNHRLQVFSLTGEHRRSITGEWSQPQQLCCAKDRLYLIEGQEHGDEAYESQGRRILVLSLQGDVLQVVTHPTERGAVFTSICCFDRKLLAAYRYYNYTERRTEYGLLALRGL